MRDDVVGGERLGVLFEVLCSQPFANIAHRLFVPVATRRRLGPRYSG
jgi:hypothetical protein